MITVAKMKAAGEGRVVNTLGLLRTGSMLTPLKQHFATFVWRRVIFSFQLLSALLSGNTLMEEAIDSSICKLKTEVVKKEILLQSLDVDTPVKNNCTPNNTMNKDVHLHLELKVIVCKVNLNLCNHQLSVMLIIYYTMTYYILSTTGHYNLRLTFSFGRRQ